MFPSPEITGEQHISWEAHLCGFVVGFVFSLLFDTQKYVKSIIYDWQKSDFDASQDSFMKHFDEKGNFISSSKFREMETEKWNYFVSNLPVIYQFKSNEEIQKSEF